MERNHLETLNCACKDCNHEIGEFKNEWLKIGKSYFMPTAPDWKTPHDAYIITQHPRKALANTLLEGAILYEVSCGGCAKQLGFQCHYAPPTHFLKAGQMLFRLNNFYMVSWTTSRAAEPLVKQQLNLANPPPYGTRPTTPNGFNDALYQPSEYNDDNQPSPKVSRLEFNQLREDVDRMSESTEKNKRDQRTHKEFVTKVYQESKNYATKAEVDDLRKAITSLTRRNDSLKHEVTFLKNKLSLMEGEVKSIVDAPSSARPLTKKAQRNTTSVGNNSIPAAGTKIRLVSNGADMGPPVGALQPGTNSTGNKKPSGLSNVFVAEGDEDENTLADNALNADESYIGDADAENTILEPPAKKKRGRPSKASIAAQKAWEEQQKNASVGLGNLNSNIDSGAEAARKPAMEQPAFKKLSIEKPADVSAPASVKKRGRPSKADKLARQQAQAQALEISQNHARSESRDLGNSQRKVRSESRDFGHSQQEAGSVSRDLVGNTTHYDDSDDDTLADSEIEQSTPKTMSAPLASAKDAVANSEIEQPASNTVSAPPTAAKKRGRPSKADLLARKALKKAANLAKKANANNVQSTAGPTQQPSIEQPGNTSAPTSVIKKKRGRPSKADKLARQQAIEDSLNHARSEFRNLADRTINHESDDEVSENEQPNPNSMNAPPTSANKRGRPSDADVLARQQVIENSPQPARYESRYDYGNTDDDSDYDTVANSEFEQPFPNLVSAPPTSPKKRGRPSKADMLARQSHQNSHSQQNARSSSRDFESEYDSEIEQTNPIPNTMAAPPTSVKKRGRPSKADMLARQALQKSQQTSRELRRSTSRSVSRDFESEDTMSAPRTGAKRGHPSAAFDADGIPLTATGTRDKRFKDGSFSRRVVTPSIIRTRRSVEGGGRDMRAEVQRGYGREERDGDVFMTGARGMSEDGFDDGYDRGRVGGGGAGGGGTSFGHDSEEREREREKRDRLAKEIIEREMRGALMGDD